MGSFTGNFKKIWKTVDQLLVNIGSFFWALLDSFWSTLVGLLGIFVEHLGSFSILLGSFTGTIGQFLVDCKAVLGCFRANFGATFEKTFRQL